MRDEPPLEPTPDFAVELAFTDACRRHENAPPHVREIACLRAMYPANFRPILRGDRFAGRVVFPLAGFCLEPAFGDTGYYCKSEDIRRSMERHGTSGQLKARVEEMLAYWVGRTTRAKHDAALPEQLARDTRNSIAGGGPRLAGVLPNFHKLLKLGLPGLRAQIAQHRSRAEREGADVGFYDGMSAALDLLADVCRFYADQARSLARNTPNSDWKADLIAMAKVLDRIAIAPPGSFREAAQLFWLYALLANAINYGRMDIFLGDFYAHDIDAGVLDETEALSLLQSLWRLIAVRRIWFNSRVVIGGEGRPNEAAADRFALLAMEATRTVIETEPQLSLRFHGGQNPALFAKALDVIGEGRTYPMLYNDDVNVPAVEHCFGVSREAAEQYYPYGCGEYALDHISFGSPNCAFNLLKALEAVLHNGHDAQTGKPLGLATGEPASFGTFDELLSAHKKQLDYYSEALVRRHAVELKVEAEASPFLFASMLYDGCLESGKSLANGGCRYTGCVLETFGMVNAADSLTAINRLVYDRKALTLAELVAALDADFVGHEPVGSARLAEIRRMLLEAPKFGNDDDEADAMLRLLSDYTGNVTRAQAAKVGMDYAAIVNINNYANVSLGKASAASADGRRAGEPLANGNTPTAGRDRKGVTAFLNSLTKPDPKVHAGYVQNMKFSRQMFAADRPKLEALLRTYFAKGGAQAMITVVGRDDLENAIREPEKYANLIVRVGGFSARFVNLTEEVQKDLLQRTLY